MRSRDDEDERRGAARPALDRLDEDQDTLIEQFYEGFDSRRHIVEWMPRLIARTLGTLRHKTIKGLVIERPLVACMIDGPNLYRENLRKVNGDMADEMREAFVARFIVPACREAYKKMRWNVVEYVEDEEEGLPNPEDQDHVAMRPAISDIESRQTKAIETLLDGFMEKKEVLKWGKSLNQASNGEVGKAFARRCYFEGGTRRLLMDDSSKGVFARGSIAATHILPEFNRAVSDLAEDAGELAQAEKTQTMEPGVTY